MSTLPLLLIGLLRASAQAAILTLVVLAAQWIFQKQLSARWRHALWLLVAARLVLPILPSSPLSLYNVARAPQAAKPPADAAMPGEMREREFLSAPREQRAAAVLPRPTIKEVTAGVIAARRAATAPWFRRENAPIFWLWIWLAGLVFFSSRIFGRNFLFWRRLGSSTTAAAAALLALFDECRREMGVKTNIRLAESGMVKSPALYGLVHRTLLLPGGMAGRFSGAELRHIFLHELAHVKRHDMFVLWLVTGCNIVHWFNPVLWLGFRRMAGDRELACDELALNHAGPHQSGPYGETILKLLELCSRPTVGPGLVGILEEKAQMRRRITLIAAYTPRRPWPGWAALILVGLGVVTLTDAQTGKLDAGLEISDASPVKTSANLTQAQQDCQNAIAAYEKDQAAVRQHRRAAAAAIFNLGEAYRQLGEKQKANEQYQRVVTEFPDLGEFTGLCQQYLLSLPKAPPVFVLAIHDVLYPGGVATDSAGNIYVSDTHRDRIRKFTIQGEPISQWGLSGREEGCLNYPQGLAMDASDHLYVADVENNRVQKFSAEGTFLKAWGGLGSGPGKFNRPYSIAIDKGGNLYVVDSENNRVQKFTSEGVYLREYGSLGTGKGGLRSPQGVAVDAAGNVYVGNGCNGRVEKFTAGGAPLPPLECGGVHDVALDAQGNLYVANTSSSCVQLFSPDGTLVTQWGSDGHGPGQFDFLARVAVDSAHFRVLITDARNNRAQVFAYAAEAGAK